MHERDLDGNLLKDMWGTNTEMPAHIGRIWMSYFYSEIAKNKNR